MNRQAREITPLPVTRPAIESAAAILLDRASGSTRTAAADLSILPVVVPTSRSHRLLTAALADEAAARRLPLVPPQIVLPHEIPSLLFGSPGTPASDTQRLLAWALAIANAPPGSLASLAPNGDAALSRPSAPECRRLAALAISTSDELAKGMLTFRQAAQRIAKSEAARFIELAHIQEAALALLDSAGVNDDPLATAQRVANAPPLGDQTRTLVLLAIEQLAPIERTAIERAGVPVLALTIGPGPESIVRDSLGCISAGSGWSRQIDLDESRIRFVDEPEQQARAALAALAETPEDAKQGEPIDATTAVICAPSDDALDPIVRRAALDAGVTVRPAKGTTIRSTTPGTLLAALLRHAREPSFDSAATLVTHPDLARALEQIDPPRKDEQGPLQAIDRLRAEIPRSSARVPPQATDNAVARTFNRTASALQATLGPLWTEPQASRDLAKWADAIRSAFAAVYAHDTLDPNDRTQSNTIAALNTIADAINEVEAATLRLPGGVNSTAADTIELIQERVASVRIPRPPERDAIEALGWLDLPLDPAPSCVIAGLQERVVPEPSHAGPLLSDAARRDLGLPTADDRLDRDAAILDTVAATRRLTVIACRRNDSGDPDPPSRLLFRRRGPDLARRFLRLVEPQQHPPPPLAPEPSAGDTDRFAPPLTVADHYQPPESMRVTEFRRYLASPAAWYLEHALRLKEAEEPAPELTPPQIGNIVHDALHACANDQNAADLDEQDLIHAALDDFMRTELRRRIGPNPTAAVAVQFELLRFRIAPFAAHEAQRRRDGWRIARSEWAPPSSDPNAALLFDDAPPMGLRGRIDRVEVNNDGERWALIDFKTGANADARKAHIGRDGWRDLQLPLYRVLARTLAKELGLDPATPELAFVSFPHEDATGPEESNPFSRLDLNKIDLEAADETAARVVREIRALEPGSALPLGDRPNNTGALGFITSERFASAGLAAGDENNTEDAATPEDAP